MNRIQPNRCLFLNLWHCAVLFSAQFAAGQGTFQNLNFESASVPNIRSDQTAFVLTTDALPGWTTYSGPYQQSQVLYNGISLGGALVSLVDRHTLGYSNNVIGGSFTVTLDSGSIFINGNQILVSAAIAQSGMIPGGSMSLRFDASWNVGALSVTFGGHVLPFYALSSGPNYTRYGADVSAFAGQSAELRFTEQPNPPPSVFTIAFLDNIFISPEAIPEPSVLGLFGLVALLFGWRLRSR
jgi:PEP-CTERM motif